MARILLVYNTQRIGIATPVEMARIQQVEMAHVLARLGHQVDIATAELSLLVKREPSMMAERLRRIYLSRVRWEDYDVVETNCHQGWETLVRYGGSDHPFVIAKIDSVVGPRDMDGIYFYGRSRERMFETQRAVHAGARYVTLRTRPAQKFWTELYGARDRHLLLAGAASSEIPAKGADPFPSRGGIRVLFSGNIWATQPQTLSNKLNTLGKLIAPHGRLFFVGTGNTKFLDPRYVTNLGAAPYVHAWQHMLHADVGVVVAAESVIHNNEATKTYYYLRSGLPTVSEAGFPNDDVVTESGLGSLVPIGDMDAMAARVIEAAHAQWDRAAAQRYILANHTWEARVKTYHDVIAEHFPNR